MEFVSHLGSSTSNFAGGDESRVFGWFAQAIFGLKLLLRQTEGILNLEREKERI